MDATGRKRGGNGCETLHGDTIRDVLTVAEDRDIWHIQFYGGDVWEHDRGLGVWWNRGVQVRTRDAA